MAKHSERHDWPPTLFGERLRALRERRGYTQQALADAVGTTVMYVSKLERGVHEPRWPAVVVLARALGVGVEEFVSPHWVEVRFPTPPPRKRERPPRYGKKKPEGGTP